MLFVWATNSILKLFIITRWFVWFNLPRKLYKWTPNLFVDPGWSWVVKQLKSSTHSNLSFARTGSSLRRAINTTKISFLNLRFRNFDPVFWKASSIKQILDALSGLLSNAKLNNALELLKWTTFTFRRCI